MAGHGHILNTVIQLRYDTYTHWMNSRIILKVGEAAIASFPSQTVIDGLSNTYGDHTPPAIGIKIGDGQHWFSELPWVQAVAADVYNWAKTAQKPTYSASEITGLASFLEENFNLSGDVTIAPRIYQIVQGSDENINKYYLRYKESNEEAQWIIDTNHPIDLTPYADLRAWIGERVMTDKASLANFTADQTRVLLSRIANTDNGVRDHYFVTRVTQTDGLIDVSRAQPSFSDLSGYAIVSQGGTGRTSFPANTVLLSDGSDQLSYIALINELNNTNSLVPSSVIKSYIDNAVAGLTGAMHFIGSANVVIRPNSSVNPNIAEYNFANALPGDVILYGSQEFVWDGGQWILLGDEGSYAVKGSIKDVDIAADAAISQDKIANLASTLDTKVDKIEGKTLSSNDFSDEAVTKLEGIEDGAQRNTIEHILLNGTEVRPSTTELLNNAVNLQITEFDAASQNKLQSIAAGADVNTIEGIVYDGTPLTPNENKIVTITSNPHTEHINVIESIYINDRVQPVNQDKEVHITIDQEALNLNVVAGAEIPPEQGNEKVEIEQINKKLQFNRIAVTGDVKELSQTNDTYIILNCGSSTEVI